MLWSGVSLKEYVQSVSSRFCDIINYYILKVKVPRIYGYVHHAAKITDLLYWCDL